MGSFTSSPKELPDQPVPTVDPEVERLAHVVVDGLIARLALEPAVPAPDPSLRSPCAVI